MENMKKKIINISTLLLFTFVLSFVFFNFVNMNKINNTPLSNHNNGPVMKQSSLGYNHSSLVTNDGTYDHLYMWGENRVGQLGTGDTVDQIFPTEILFGSFLGPDETIKQVSLGKNFSAAIINDGTKDHLYMWGDNSYGQLGTGDTENKLVPTEVTIGDYALTEDETIKQIGVGEGFGEVISAIVNDGTNDHLYMWGDNSYGQLGLGDKENRSLPTEVSVGNSSSNENATLKQVSIGAEHSGVIMNDGTNDHLYMWGSNLSGQLGIRTSKEELLPKDITTGGFELQSNQKIKKISFGYLHSGAIVFDGIKDQVYMWGNNLFGQIGTGGILRWMVPTDITIDDYELTDGETITDISLGATFSSAIMNDGTNDHLYTWGDNEYGQLGIGSKIWKKQPTEVFTNGYTLKQVSLGFAHSSTIINDGTDDHIYMWGNGEHGQLGIGGNFPKDSKHLPTIIDNSKANKLGMIGEPENIFLTSDGGSFDINITDGVNDGVIIPSIDLNINHGSIEVKGKEHLEVGKNSISVTNLNPGDDVSITITLNSLMEDSIKIINGKFKEIQIIYDLINAKINTQPTKDSVGIYVEALSKKQDSFDINYNVNKYSLEVVDENDHIIGESSASDLNTNGPQEFTLSNLEVGKKYNHVKVRVSEDHSIVSNEFDFETKKEPIFSLENLKATNVEFSTATINVDTLIEAEKNTPVQDYVLVVKNTLNDNQWKSNVFNETGTQTIDIDNLNSDYTYNEGDIIVSVEGTEISSPVEEFKTKVSPIKIDPDSFSINEESITDRSFTFTVNINITEGYTGFHPSEDLHLLSNKNQELKTSYVNNIGETYTYNVSGLHGSRKYSDFKIKIDNITEVTSMKNISIKTKRNDTIFYSILFSSIGAFIIFIIMIIIFIINNKNANEKYNKLIGRAKNFSKEKSDNIKNNNKKNNPKGYGKRKYKKRK